MGKNCIESTAHTGPASSCGYIRYVCYQSNHLAVRMQIDGRIVSHRFYPTDPSAPLTGRTTHFLSSIRSPHDNRSLLTAFDRRALDRHALDRHYTGKIHVRFRNITTTPPVHQTTHCRSSARLHVISRELASRLFTWIACLSAIEPIFCALLCTWTHTFKALWHRRCGRTFARTERAAVIAQAGAHPVSHQ